MNILNGLRSLCVSSKGTLTLIVFGCSFVALMTHHLDSPSFAAIVSVVASIYHWTSHAETIASINLPPKGTL